MGERLVRPVVAIVPGNRKRKQAIFQGGPGADVVDDQRSKPITGLRVDHDADVRRVAGQHPLSLADRRDREPTQTRSLVGTGVLVVQRCTCSAGWRATLWPCTLAARPDHGVTGKVSFVSVARLEDLPRGGGLRVTVDGIGVGLYRVDDQVYAMEDACPHAGFPISKGDLHGCVVTCQAHGWLFDVRTGFDPHHADGFPVPCFAVEVAGGDVRIDLERQINDPRPKR